MENKYYTPSIEEFRVGFEFEVQLENSQWATFVYDKFISMRMVYSTFGQGEPDFTFEDKLNKGKVRVKSLDHDDIIAEGWSKGEDGYYVLDEYALEVFNDEINISDTHGFGWGYDEEWSRLYKGKILNRSELNFLMKRLGII